MAAKSAHQPAPPAARIFFVRHGETVDNVAQVYAGVTNSALTNHGVQQATRLGEFLADRGERFDHIFASDLDRAFLTAEAIRKAQLKVSASSESVPAVCKLAVLQEQNFGSYERLSFFAAHEASSSANPRSLVGEKDFQEQETYESVSRRADAFLDKHLLPILKRTNVEKSLTIAVVSHGITLSFLWKRFLKRLPQHSVSIDPEVLADRRPLSLEHLGAWSNTGFLQLDMFHEIEHRKHTVDGSLGEEHESQSGDTSVSLNLVQWKTTIVAINGRLHLQGLRRTKGGIGSSKFDDKQTSINDFFRRNK